MLVSVVSIFKAIGPSAGAVLFAWSVSGDVSPPGSNRTEFTTVAVTAPTELPSVGRSAVAKYLRGGAVFYLCAGLSLVMFAMSYKLIGETKREAADREDQSHEKIDP